MKEEKMIIIGAGLCGCLLAIRLAQLGYEVDLFEKRPDPRIVAAAGGRSINLALSDRGIQALRSAGLNDEVRDLCLPMEGRMIHTKSGESRFSRYSGRQEDYINSISRSGLNLLLLEKADEHDNLRVHFNHQCNSVDLEAGAAKFYNTKNKRNESHTADFIFGCDGAGSAVRRSMMSRSTSLLFNYSQHFLKTGYKELEIPPSEDGGFRIENNALHIWPRGSYMIIALPNLDGSFTVTLFWPFEGKNGFKYIDNKERLLDQFREEFPSLLTHLPELVDDYFDNPTGTLGNIKCAPWAVGKTLLLGDAAHAIVPFYGQGMNASFEDVQILLDTYSEELDWARTIHRFAEERKPDGDAIADLAIDNFYEMQDKVDDLDFIAKRKLEMRLEQEFPDYYSKYSLVTFREELPYSEAMRIGRKQDEILLNICRNGELESHSLDKIREIIRLRLAQ